METQKNFKKVVLANGLTVLLYKIESVMSASAILFVRTGAVFEKEEDRGVSHLIEHSAFIGTKKFPDGSEISNFAENLGILYNGGTSKDSTYYTIKSPSIHFDKTLELLSEFVFNPILNDNEVSREREIILSEYNDFWNNPERKFDHIMWEKRFSKPNHPYARRPMGIPKTINNLTLDKVSDYRNRFYNPSNMVLSIAGNFDSDIENTLNDLFNAQKGTREEEPKFDSSDYSNFVLYNQDDKRPQISFYLSFPAFGSREVDRAERLKLRLLSTILGSNRSSRLYTRLRRKEKYVYKVTSEHRLLSYMGALVISGSVPVEKLLDTMKAIKEELDVLVGDGIKKEELKLAKNFRISLSLMQFDNPGDVARYYGEEFFYEEEVMQPQQVIDEINKISVVDLENLVKKIVIYKKLNIGLLGDVSSEILKEIKNTFKK